MRITIFLLFNILMTFTIQAQSEANANIEWGKEYAEPSGTFLSEVVAIRGEHFYAVREKTPNGLLGDPSKVFVEYYHKGRMNLIKSKELSLKYKNKTRRFEKVLMLGNNLYFLTSFHNEAKKLNYLFTQFVDRKTLSLDSHLQMIGNIETRSVVNEGKFNFHVSKDSSKLLIVNELPYKKSEPERFSLRVYDESFAELWNRDITLPYPDGNFTIEEYQVDTEGNVYLLGVLYKDASRARYKGKPNYQYVILSYPADGSEAKKHMIHIGDQFITDLAFRIDNRGNLVCTGFWSNKGTYSIRGTYFFHLNPKSQEITNSNINTFDLDFLTADMSRGKQRRMKKAEIEGTLAREPELNQYALDEIILRSDGGVVLIAEQYYVYRDNRRDFYYGGSYNTNYYYNYNDIIVVNIRPNGDIQWASRIPKRQVSYNDGGYYSSYSMSIVRDKLYFVFNDNGRNFSGDNRDTNVRSFRGYDSVVSLAELNKNGELKIRPLFANRDADVLTRPKVCRQSGKQQMIIYGERGRRYRFANLEFIPDTKS